LSRDRATEFIFEVAEALEDVGGKFKVIVEEPYGEGRDSDYLQLQDILKNAGQRTESIKRILVARNIWASSSDDLHLVKTARTANMLVLRMAAAGGPLQLRRQILTLKRSAPNVPAIVSGLYGESPLTVAAVYSVLHSSNTELLTTVMPPRRWRARLATSGAPRFVSQQGRVVEAGKGSGFGVVLNELELRKHIIEAIDLEKKDLGTIDDGDRTLSRIATDIEARLDLPRISAVESTGLSYFINELRPNEIMVLTDSDAWSYRRKRTSGQYRYTAMEMAEIAH